MLLLFLAIQHRLWQRQKQIFIKIVRKCLSKEMRNDFWWIYNKPSVNYFDRYSFLKKKMIENVIKFYTLRLIWIKNVTFCVADVSKYLPTISSLSTNFNINIWKFSVYKDIRKLTFFVSSAENILYNFSDSCGVEVVNKWRYSSMMLWVAFFLWNDTQTPQTQVLATK